MIAPSVMNLTALEAFSGNYIWMMNGGNEAIVAGPATSGPVDAALDARRLELATILWTGQDADGVGDIDALRCRFANRAGFPRNGTLPSIDFR
jgi:hypothetical protein